jgi:serine/threonine-protein kinase
MFRSPGDVIAQRYELDQLLGEGGMGTVWSARHRLTHKRVAVKFLKSAAEPELVRRFVREARAASAVQHPNVIGIHDVLMLEDGVPAMVMDLLEGESLAQRLERTGPISVYELSSLMLPVLSAVGAVHALGIVHRDLKPDNVFLARRGEGIEPMVLDFGICKLTSPSGLLTEESTLTATGSMMGTPFYMAPEQVFGERDLDARADVWALGVMLYECSTGRRPVDGENIGQLMKQILAGTIRPMRELLPHAPPDFVKVVQHMLVQDRNQRAPDLREAFEVLRTMTDVGAQSFGAAATLRILQPSELPSAPRDASTLAASVASRAVTSSSRSAGSVRRVRVLAAAAAVAALAGAALLPSVLQSKAPVKTDLRSAAASPTTAAAALPAPPAIIPSPSVVAATSAPSAPSAAAATSADAVARSGSARPRPSAAPVKSPRTLAGGVHGTVPF